LYGVKQSLRDAEAQRGSGRGVEEKRRENVKNWSLYTVAAYASRDVNGPDAL
jgi:hypothetical protein